MCFIYFTTRSALLVYFTLHFGKLQQSRVGFINIISYSLATSLTRNEMYGIHISFYSIGIGIRLVNLTIISRINIRDLKWSLLPSISQLLYSCIPFSLIYSKQEMHSVDHCSTYSNNPFHITWWVSYGLWAKTFRTYEPWMIWNPIFDYKWP